MTNLQVTTNMATNPVLYTHFKKGRPRTCRQFEMLGLVCSKAGFHAPIMVPDELAQILALPLPCKFVTV